MNINLLGGIRIVDESQIGAPPDPQAEFGLDLDYTGDEWPWGISLCATTYYSKDDYSGDGWDVESRTLEVHVGLRKIWNLFEYLNPYFGVGAAGAKMKVDLHGRSSSRIFHIVHQE